MGNSTSKHGIWYTKRPLVGGTPIPCRKRRCHNLPYEKIGKNEPVCIADEVPFEIPESWEWVTLKQVAISELGKTLDKSKNTGLYHPYLCSINVYWTGIDLSTVKQARFEDSELPKYRLKRGDLLICEGGDVGRSAVWDKDDEMYYQNALHRVRFYGGINPYFFQLLLECYKSTKILDKCSKGMTIKHLVQSALSSIYFPLPPLNEQRRIIEKVNNLTPYLERYNTTEARLSKLNSNFPGNLKQSILQYAIQGKLVPQDPADEPASALLERIRIEKEQLIKSGKIKRDKHESVIFRRDNSYYERVDGIERCIDDEIPFEIPNSWEWVRLKNIVNVVSARRVHQSDWKESGIPFYRAREIAKLADDGYVDNELFISENLYNEFSKSGAPKSGDLMVTAVGTLGKVYVVQPADKFYYKDASVICFMNFGKLNPEYLKLVMMSPFMVSAIKDHSTGTTVGTITLVTANEYLVPVPPILEQTRIVAHFQKLSHLISACNI